MTVNQQAAIVLEAINDGFLQAEEVIRWADTVLIAESRPASWLIELSTLNSASLVDCIAILQAQAELGLAPRRRIQIVILAYQACMIDLPNALSKLFKIVMNDRCGEKSDTLYRRLRELLAEWDQRDDFPVVHTTLKARLELIFDEYLSDATAVSEILMWKSCVSSKPYA